MIPPVVIRIRYRTAVRWIILVAAYLDGRTVHHAGPESGYIGFWTGIRRQSPFFLVNGVLSDLKA
jgi:hypothetical protein